MVNEVVNRVLQQYIRCFVADYLKSWSKILHWAEYAYNVPFHSSLLMSHFKAIHGREPPFMLDYLPTSAKIEAVD